MDTKDNAIVTITIIILCYLMAICVPDIGGVISISGATVNPFIGFLFPIFFWLQIENKHHEKKVRLEERRQSYLDRHKHIFGPADNDGQSS